MYDADYFLHHRAGVYNRVNPHWQRFFGALAQFVVDFIKPASVLEVGCAIGILVEELQARGVAVQGFDISEYAVSEAQRLRLPVRVGDITDPGVFLGYRDLVICLEVLEHVAPEKAEIAIDNLCTWGDRILFSSTPFDKDDPTHCNVQPFAFWLAEFARRGWRRKPLLEPAGLIPWSLYLERA